MSYKLTKLSGPITIHTGTSGAEKDYPIGVFPGGGLVKNANPFQIWNLSPRKWKVESLSFVHVNADGVLCAGEVRSAQNQSVTLEPHQSDLSELSVTVSGIEGSGQIWLEFVGGSFRATSDSGDIETVRMNQNVPVFVLVEKV